MNGRNPPKELLWVIPKWPMPAQDGARVATCKLLEGLTRRGHPIDLLVICGDEEAPGEVEISIARKRLGVRNVHQVRRPSTPRSALGSFTAILGSLLRHPWMPVTFRNFARGEVARQVDALLREASAPWWGIVYDGLHPAIHSSRLGRYKISFQERFRELRIFYRAHNFEADIWRRKAEQTTSFPVKGFLNLQARLVRRFEKSLLEAAQGVAAVSAEDLRALRGLCPGVGGRVVPIGNDFGVAPPDWEKKSELEIVFIGKLDWPPNREGLAWFLAKVWPKAQAARPELKLLIVGSGSSGWLPSLLGASGVSFLGRVEDLDEIYRRGVVCIAPIFYGSGTRVKVIEASRYGRACLSTAIGVEGTGLIPGTSYLRAETDVEWVECLAGLDPESALRVGSAAFHSLKETFDTDRAAGEFERMIHESE